MTARQAATTAIATPVLPTIDRVVPLCGAAARDGTSLIDQWTGADW